jgi:hypothetical protein
VYSDRATASRFKDVTRPQKKNKKRKKNTGPGQVGKKMIFWSLLSAVSAAASGGTGSNTTAVRVLLDLDVYPNARCLDGSAGLLYLRRGWGSGADVWNLFQEGGGSCHSISDCAHRATTTQGSSTPWPATIDLEGKGPYFALNNVTSPLLWNANVAYLVYCDGGAFSGDNTSLSLAGTPIHFRGQAILRAAIATLAASGGRGLDSATAITISGCSEGGVATFAHLDWMSALVKRAAPNATVAGLADSGFYPGDGSPFSHVPMQQFLYEAQDASGCLSPRCVAANAATPWSCLVAETNHEYLRTPIFALQSVFDTNQLSTAGCKNSSCAIPYMSYLNASVVEFATAPGRATGGFIDLCSRHCNTEPTIDGYTSLQAYAEWFRGLSSAATPPRRAWLQRTTKPFNAHAPYCASCCNAVDDSERKELTTTTATASLHVAAAFAAATTSGCATDATCPFPQRCCGTSAKAENCPPPLPFAHDSACVLPGTTGATRCSCVESKCSTPEYDARNASRKQWLMIGDSISDGCLGPSKTLAASHDIQLEHNPTNAANVWWGAHCLDAWLADAARWDVISYQFGLHDLALDNERLEPSTTYATYLTNITKRIAAAAPQAKLLWVTTTPVPLGIDGYCNKTNGEGGCPPRAQKDPPIYNAAAQLAIAKSGVPGVTTLDLNAVVTHKCGANYTLCPENCSATKMKGKWVGNCYQIPHNVHYLAVGWTELSAAYVNAVLPLVQ